MRTAGRMLAVRSLLRGEFCPVCKEARGGSQLLCDACADALAAEMRRGCAACGKSMRDCTCSTRALSASGFAHLFKLFAYDPKASDGAVNKTVFVMKRRHDRLLFDLTAELMAPKLREALQALSETSDKQINAVVTYVPRSRKRIRQLGMDQSRLLAAHLARELGLPRVRLLKRRARGKAQKELSVFDRERNASHLFKLRSTGALEGATVIIVDDLVASGSTLAQAGELLLGGGAERVLVACVASLLRSSQAERFEEYAREERATLPDAPDGDIFERIE